MTTTETLSGERQDLLTIMARHRDFLRFTVRDITDEQAGLRTTVSECTLGALIKHVTLGERNWANFILEGASAMKGDVQEWLDGWTMQPTDTLADLLAAYDAVAARTEEIVRTVDLDSAHELPDQPWFAKGEAWSARRVLMHIMAETAQHAGHADIIREALDGQKTMG